MLRTAITAFTLLFLGIAAPSHGSDLRARDYAKCRDTKTDRDRYICYVRLGVKHGSYDGTLRKALFNHPDLAEEIGISLDAPPDEAPAQSSDPARRVLVDPSRNAFYAANQALELDAAGTPAEQALKPLLEANADVTSGSFYLGQITTSSPQEIRITQYRRILKLYQDETEEPHRPRPSKALVLEALRNWGKDLATPFRSYTDFKPERSKRELALAYAQLGQRDIARAILQSTSVQPARIDLELALAAGDLKAAWNQTLRLIQTNEDKGFSRSLNNIPRLAYEDGDTETLAAIRESFEDDAFLDTVDGRALFDVIKYLGPDVVPLVLASLERSSETPLQQEELISRLKIEVGRESEVDARIEELAAETRACERRQGCRSVSTLLTLLAFRNRMDEIENLIGEEKAEEFLGNVTPYRPFETEREMGTGPLKSMGLFLETDQQGIIELELSRCVQERSSNTHHSLPYRLNLNPDFEGAFHCADAFIETSQTKSSLDFHKQRYDVRTRNMKPGYDPNYSFGRQQAAYSALWLAEIMFAEDADRASELEANAIELLVAEPAKRPPYALITYALARLGANAH